MLLALLFACSTKKNTPATRAYHALTAHYNTLYNGQVAFLEGSEAQNKGHKDNFNEILPMYICTNKATAGIGKSNYETAITKCEKAASRSVLSRKATKSAPRRRRNSWLARSSTHTSTVLGL